MRTLFRVSSVAVLTGLGWCGSLFGSGFAIIEQSVSALGNAFAGGSAVAEDASTIFFNPAGMTQLDSPGLTVGMHLISPQAHFRNQGSQTVSSFGAVPTQGFDADGGVDALVPNFYYVHPVSEDLVVGLGIHAPFGLATDYDDGWVGRYVALRSDLATVNLNPSLAYRLNQRLSIGFGGSAQLVDVELSNAINFAAAVGAPGIGSTALDGKAVVSGEDWGFGFNAGMLYEVTTKTRVGIAFRSRITHNIDGDAKFYVPGSLQDTPIAAVFQAQGVKATLTVPETLSLSLFHQATDRLDLMTDVTWTNWSRFEVLDLNFENPATEASAGRAIEEGWQDTFRYSVGLSYRIVNSLKLRFGVAYDESPTPNEELRSPRIPDCDRTWVATGLTFDLTDRLTFSAAYVHIFVDDPIVNNSSHTAGQILKGIIDAEVNIFSVGGSVRF